MTTKWIILTWLLMVLSFWGGVFAQNEELEWDNSFPITCGVIVTIAFVVAVIVLTLTR